MSVVLRSSFYVVLMNVLYAKICILLPPPLVVQEKQIKIRHFYRRVCLYGFMCVNWMRQEDSHHCLSALP